jgi:hypothetical protein
MSPQTSSSRACIPLTKAELCSPGTSTPCQGLALHPLGQNHDPFKLQDKDPLILQSNQTPSTVRLFSGCNQAPSPTPASLPHLTSAQVHKDYDCTLNQTDIGNNNNKFYIIQLLEGGSHFVCWNRWGRVVSAPPAWATALTTSSCSHMVPKVPKRLQTAADFPSSSLTVQGLSARGPSNKHLWWAHSLKAVTCREK